MIWLAPVLNAYRLTGSAHVELQPDAPLVAYAAAVTLLTALVCGLAPALGSTKGRITSDIQAGSSRTATGRLRLRHSFVVAQVAISLLLLVVASLFLRSLMRLSSIDPGFDVAHGVVVRIPAAAVPAGEQVAMSERIGERMRRIVGVRSVASAMVIPLGGDNRGETFRIEGYPERRARTSVNSVSPGYFQTMGFLCFVVVTSNVRTR